MIEPVEEKVNDCGEQKCVKICDQVCVQQKKPMVSEELFQIFG